MKSSDFGICRSRCCARHAVVGAPANDPLGAHQAATEQCFLSRSEALV